ncbi:MAG: globin domain-containing protein [Chitinophagaceae bacterium]
MDNKQIHLVKKSWALVAKIDMVTVGGLFYNRLFEIMPEVKPMFTRSTLPEQSKKLLGMLGYIISKLDRLEDLMDEVTRLAQRHTQYGVEDKHYAAVASALLWTLEQGLAKEWNEDLKAAWTVVYTTLAGAMMTAQKTGMETLQRA